MTKAHADAAHDLRALIQSRHPIITIDTVEEERVDNLLGIVASGLHMPLFTWTVTHGLQRAGGENVVYGTANPQMLVRHLATLTVRGIFHLKDLHAHLGDATVVRGMRDIASTFIKSGSTAVISGGSIHLPAELTREAVPFDLHLPDHDELQQIVRQILRTLNRQHEVAVTLGADGMESLLQALSGLTLNQARQAVAWAVLDDNALSAADIPRLLRRKGDAVRQEGLLEFYPPDDNTFQLGGLEHLKAWLERARVGFTPEARALGLPPPRGVLIVGVQGCGKSLAAKVIARAWKQPLLKLDAGRLYDKFIGESEKNLQKALDFAEAIAPCILWIDEIEKGFASGGDADAGLSQRMLGSFLTWLQEREASVFVAATANDVLALPPELLRKGRFDEIFFVDLPDGPSREEIFRIHLALRRQDPSTFNLGALVAASDGFSGAEIEQAITAGLYRALHDKQPMTDASLCEELHGTQPLSVARREDVERLRETARGRFVPA
ncbi:MAG TPA: AAA family ATPase [Vicinamibacterales bacterium]|nr:AAA family ATPase [Vicinamibacterales bacterium]